MEIRVRRRRRSRTSTLMAWATHLLVINLLLLILLLPLCISFADESSSGKELPATYIVLMEGEAAAFRLFSHQIQEELIGLNSTRSVYDRQQFRGKRDEEEEEEEEEEEVFVRDVIESHNRVLEKTLEEGSYKKLYSFHHVIHGFAVHTTPSQAKRLKSAEGVVTMEKDRRVKLMTTYTPHFLGLLDEWKGRRQPAAAASPSSSGRAGEGIVIGFVDTGIDPTHPSFAYDPSSAGTTTTCDVGPMFPVGSCNGKIVSARYFCTGASKLIHVDPSKDLSPFDQIGHGSHVASTAAGNHGVPVVVNGFNYGYASGMAPSARIAVYKALYPGGGSLADVIAAIDQAIRDGVDVLTLSIGPDEPPEDVPTFMSIFDITLLFARRAGVFVAQAAGNRGPGRSTVVSYSPWAVTVASSSTDRDYNGTLVFGHGNHHHHRHHDHVSGVGLSGPTSRNGKRRFKLVAAKDCYLAVSGRSNLSHTKEYAEECQHAEALKSNLVKGNIVICNFSTGFANGTSSVINLVNTAVTLGFMGFVLVANPRYGDLVAEPLPFNVPGIVIPNVESAKMLMDYYEKHTKRDKRGNALEFNGRASILEGRVAMFDADTSIFVSRFSSRGPNVMDGNMNIPADVLKPDILAPGHQIWAAWSPTSARDPFLQGYNFAMMSGTSMSTPHVSGIAALVKQLRPKWTPSMISSAMSTTASKLDFKGRPIMSQGFQLNTMYSSTSFDLGAGMINPSKSLDPGLVFHSGFEDYVEFLCSLPNMNPSRVLKNTGRSCSNVTTIKLLSPSDLNLPSITVSNLNGSLRVRREVISVAAVVETYLASVLEPRGVNIQIIPSSFTILPEGRQNLVVILKVGEDLVEDFSFGEIVLTGSLDHIVRLPLSVRSASFGS